MIERENFYFNQTKIEYFNKKFLLLYSKYYLYFINFYKTWRDHLTCRLLIELLK